MSRSVIIAMSLVAAILTAVRAQEVVITGFPLGIGSDIDPGFFEPYYSQLQSLTDTLNKYPLCLAIVTGGTDGVRYRQNHDAQNPGLAIGRAQALRNLLVSEFGIDARRIIIQANYSPDKGGPYRYAAVRVASELSDLEARVDSLERRPPVETRVTEINEINKTMSENMGLQLGAGYSSSPFGGMPIITGAITWKKFIFVEGIFGHAIWNDSFKFNNDDLDTRLRMSGGLASVYPLSDVPVGLVGGWIRVEEISQRYYEYVKKSEGPVIGIRITPIENLSITAVQNTAKHNIAGDIKSRLKDNQFLFFATIHILFGGGK